MLPSTCWETTLPHLCLLKVYPSLKANTDAIFPRKCPLPTARSGLSCPFVPMTQYNMQVEHKGSRVGLSGSESRLSPESDRDTCSFLPHRCSPQLDLYWTLLSAISDTCALPHVRPLPQSSPSPLLGEPFPQDATRICLRCETSLNYPQSEPHLPFLHVQEHLDHYSCCTPCEQELHPIFHSIYFVSWWLVDIQCLITLLDECYSAVGLSNGSSLVTHKCVSLCVE